MTYRLRRSTRTLTTATSLVAVVAAVDVLDRHGLTGWSSATAALLVLAAVVVARLHGVAVVVDDEQVVVRNVLSTHRVPVTQLAEVRAGPRRSHVVLTDGTELPTLLSARDLAAPGPPREAVASPA